jgi:hypothetical protein
MGVFNGRRRKRPIVNHLQAASQRANGTWPTGRRSGWRSEAWADEVLRLATMPGKDLVAEVFTPEVMNQGWDSQTVDVIYNALDDQANRIVKGDHPVRKTKSEEEVEEPRRAPAPPPVDHRDAELKAALYTEQMIGYREVGLYKSQRIPRTEGETQRATDAALAAFRDMAGGEA